MKIRTASLALQRLCAWTVDLSVIGIYGLLLFVILSPVVRPLFLESAVNAEMAGFFVLTLPALLYLIISEAVFGRTIGKQLLKLRVHNSRTRGRASWSRVVLRNMMKLLPWELAHFAIWNAFIFTSSPFRSLAYGLLVVSYGIVAAYLGSLFISAGRTPYDYAAGLVVEGPEKRA